MSSASSRRMLGSPWSAPPTDEESRVFLQTRISFLFGVMFWSLAALVGFLAVLYEIAKDSAPVNRYWVYALSAAGLAPMAFIWRVLLVRRRLGAATVYRLDLVYSLGIGAAFGASAYLQHDLRAAGYLSVLYATLTVFARALIVPSSGPRTALASSITMAPIVLASVGLVVHHEQDVPAPLFVGGCLLFSTVSVVLAASGSRIIYGLRRDATAALQLDQYKIDRKIAEGGMGTVYLAHHALLRRPTAIKVVRPDRVDPETLARFEREGHYTSELTHPNTVAIYDFGRSPEGEFYYAMEYLGGGIDLDKLVRRFGAQPSGRVVRILTQVCGALHEAHLRGFIHRDVKPANIILCQRGGLTDVAKVVDYGLVQDVGEVGGSSTQIVIGTADYLAPERIDGASTIGPGVDIYALGAVGYFLLTGRPVFEGKTSFEVCRQHLEAAPLPPSEGAPAPPVPGLDTILLRCLAKQPADRYASARELRDALLALPHAGDWDDAAARRWWREIADTVADATPAGELPMRAITVDLGAPERG